VIGELYYECTEVWIRNTHWRDAMQMPMTAEDVIVGIFYHLHKKKLQEVTADREELHRAFFAVKQKYPTVMKLFSFREREVFPESTQLDQALSNLDATGLISRKNLAPRYYRFEKPLDASFSKFSKKTLKAAGIADKTIRDIAQELFHPLRGERP
jgi:hypothetical protein